ncbi:hypothetical protein BPOR_0549g00040 [Botrytis porri]|uniref:C2H2-type domain-containing protein n=1 Tax=Botrytis porri TaxID=87229 RepID=A0A4Z1KIN9_9HELO|nr:hypothetical protein BPOR_0549g00040 [Botrytis porri]
MEVESNCLLKPKSMSEDNEISTTTDKDLTVADGTVDEQATLGELHNVVSPEAPPSNDGTVDEQATLGELHNVVSPKVPPSNDEEMPDTPESSSTNNPPNEDSSHVDTEKVKRYTCPSCKKTYVTTREAMSHIAPIDMEQEEVLKCPHCGVPSIRETLEFTEEIIEARPKRIYIPMSRGEKRFLCPHCKRTFNTTLETMLTLIPEITEQGELRTCLYCKKPSLKTTLEVNPDTMLREYPHFPIQADKNSSSNSNIQPSRQPSFPDQASTGTPSSRILEGIIHTSASQNSPYQQQTFQSNLYQQQPAVYPNPNLQTTLQITLDQRTAIQRTTNRFPDFQTAFDQQSAFHPSLNRQSISQSSFNQQSSFSPTHHQQLAFQSNLSQQPIARPTLEQQQQQQQLAVHFNPNQQSTFGPNTDQQLASNPSSQRNLSAFPNL